MKTDDKGSDKKKSAASAPEPNHFSLCTEEVLEETLRGHVEPGMLQSICLANYMLPLEKSDIANANTDPGAQKILKDFAALRRYEASDLSAVYTEKACALPAPAKALFMARAIATVEETTQNFIKDPGTLDMEFLENYGETLSTLMNSGGIPGTLPGRMADAFNILSSAVKSSVRLHENRESGLYFASCLDRAAPAQVWSFPALKAL